MTPREFRRSYYTSTEATEAGFANTPVVPMTYLHIRYTYKASVSNVYETRDVYILLGIWKQPSTVFSTATWGVCPLELSPVASATRTALERTPVSILPALEKEILETAMYGPSGKHFHRKEVCTLRKSAQSFSCLRQGLRRSSYNVVGRTRGDMLMFRKRALCGKEPIGERSQTFQGWRLRGSRV